MFSGYLQAAVYKGLNGVQGFAGWQWLFVSWRRMSHTLKADLPSDHGRYHQRTHLYRWVLLAT